MYINKTGSCSFTSFLWKTSSNTERVTVKTQHFEYLTFSSKLRLSNKFIRNRQVNNKKECCLLAVKGAACCGVMLKADTGNSLPELFKGL